MRLPFTSDLPTADPYLTGHGDPAWSAAHYALDLDYDLAGNRLRGDAVIDAVAEEQLSRVVLDLAGLEVSKVTVDGRPPAKYATRGNRLVVTLKEPVPAGGPFRLVVKYAGAPRPLVERHHGDAGWEELADGVIVAGQPHGAPTWFPCNDRPDDKASYSITVTAAADYTVVSNGELVASKRGASTVTWHYEQVEPMATYLATVQIGRYELPRTPARRSRWSPRSLRTWATASRRRSAGSRRCWPGSSSGSARTRSRPTPRWSPPTTSRSRSSRRHSRPSARTSAATTGTRSGWSPTSWPTSGSATP